MVSVVVAPLYRLRLNGWIAVKRQEPGDRFHPGRFFPWGERLDSAGKTIIRT
ncbi:MAG: hypothetical protein KKI04_02680 [Proteobacteria bacterium]|nr:hypothetical protein [Pseudomonadota bacterium]